MIRCSEVVGSNWETEQCTGSVSSPSHSSIGVHARPGLRNYSEDRWVKWHIRIPVGVTPYIVPETVFTAQISYMPSGVPSAQIVAKPDDFLKPIICACLVLLLGPRL